MDLCPEVVGVYMQGLRAPAGEVCERQRISGLGRAGNTSDQGRSESLEIMREGACVA